MRKIIRGVAIVAGSLCLLVVLVAAVGYVASQRKIAARYDIAAESVPIPTDSVSIARGRHLTRAIAKCVNCHGDDLGGAVVADDPAMGHWQSANLTSGRGGVAPVMKDADWVRAIRHGVGHDGRALIVMPSLEYANLAAGDVGQIVAYLKSVAPVDRVQPPVTLGPVARGLIATNKVPFYDAAVLDHSKPAPALAPKEGPTPEYGDYLVHTAGCAGCHAPTLAGGKIEAGDPSWPPAANLTPTGLKAYDEAAFFQVLRTGVRKDGSKIREPMPWKLTREMTDDEIRAVWLYLKTVPPREFGAR